MKCCRDGIWVGKLALAGVISVAPLLATNPASAQQTDIPPEITAEIQKTLENDKDYQETQKLLQETEGRIAKVRTETDARAKEIEALALRVGDIIANIGATSEDNSNLRSEMSVVNDLLSLERQTTHELRQDILVVNQKLDEANLARLKSDRQKDQTLSALRTENAKALKRLNESVETIADLAKTNQVLASDLEKATAEMERMEREIQLLKRGRYRPKRRTR